MSAKTQTPESDKVFLVLAEAVGKFIKGEIYSSDLFAVLAEAEKEVRSIEHRMDCANHLIEEQNKPARFRRHCLKYQG